MASLAVDAAAAKDATVDAIPDDLRWLCGAWALEDTLGATAATGDGDSLRLGFGELATAVLGPPPRTVPAPQAEQELLQAQAQAAAQAAMQAPQQAEQQAALPLPPLPPMSAQLCAALAAAAAASPAEAAGGVWA